MSTWPPVFFRIQFYNLFWRISVTSCHLVCLSSFSLLLQSEHWAELGDIQIQAKKKQSRFQWWLLICTAAWLYTSEMPRPFIALRGYWRPVSSHWFQNVLICKCSLFNFVWVDDVVLFICCPTCAALWSSTVILICTLQINCDVTSNKNTIQSYHLILYHLPS